MVLQITIVTLSFPMVDSAAYNCPGSVPARVESGTICAESDREVAFVNANFTTGSVSKYSTAASYSIRHIAVRGPAYDLQVCDGTELLGLLDVRLG
jgi:hypothetical protein